MGNPSKETIDHPVEHLRSAERSATHAARACLIVLWSELEPARSGEVLLSGRQPRLLGRFDPDVGGAETLLPIRQRPGENEACPPLDLPQHVSRRQLVVGTIGGNRLRVTRVGRAAVLRNGEHELPAGEETTLAPGETLLVGGVLLLLVSSRPDVLEAGRFATKTNWPRFGEPDADGIVGESPAVWALRESIAFAAETTRHVLIQGASGTGKELTARGVHRLSGRGAKRLVAHSAADIPPNLLEVELFGNRRDYPNPGTPGREGLIGTANGTSLLLDEIALLPTELQGKLLRVLDEGGAFRRLGVDEEQRSDFRLIAATNRPASMLKDDLLARLKIRIHTPALLERQEDIPLLIRHLVRKLMASPAEARIASRFLLEGKCEVRDVNLDPLLLDRWMREEHPLNVRGLEAELLHAMGAARGSRIEQPLPGPAGAHGAGPPLTPRAAPLRPAPVRGPEDLDREEVEALLKRAGGNVTHAARELGWSRYQLIRKMKKCGLAPSE